MPWRRKWQPTPLFLPGESHGQRRLAGYSQQCHKESGTTERFHFLFTFHSCKHFPGGASGKDPSTNAVDARDVSWVPGLENPLEQEMATHSNILAWRIPWTEAGGLQAMGSQGVRQDWEDEHTHAFCKGPSNCHPPQLPPLLCFSH